MAKGEKLNEEAATNNNLTAATYSKSKTAPKQKINKEIKK
jgi:hypothetical protein